MVLHGALNLKKFFAILLALMMLVYPNTAYAAENVSSGSCGVSLAWKLDSDGALTISGSGDMTNYTFNRSGAMNHDLS